MCGLLCLQEECGDCSMIDAEILNISRRYEEELQAKKRERLNATSSGFKAFWTEAVARNHLKPATMIWDRYLEDLQDKKPSEIFSVYEKDIAMLIGADNLKAFYYVIDEVTNYQYDWSVFRRSYRSSDRRKYIHMINHILTEFILFDLMDVDLCDFLTGNFSGDLKAYRIHHSYGSYVEYIIAARLGIGDKRLEETLADIVLNGNGDVNSEIIGGIFMSRNEEMFKLMERLLLAARLQEGLRQAVCERIDCGTIEAFLHMYKVILDNDLMRFSSVQRAIEVFTGLIEDEQKGGDRITKKQAPLIYKYLTDDKAREEALYSNDHMEVYLALWAVGNTDVEDACIKAMEVAINGSRESRLSALYFLASTCTETSKFLDMLEHFEEDLEAHAIIFGGFLTLNMTSLYMDEALRRAGGPKRDSYKRIYADPQLVFKDRQEAARSFRLLDRIRVHLTKTKMDYSGIVFPWHKVTLTKTDYSTRMAYCASVSGEAELTLAAARELSSVEKWQRADALELLLSEPMNREEYELLTAAVGDGETETRGTAFKMMTYEISRDTSSLDDPEIQAPAGKLPSLCYKILEDLLKSKKSDVRQNALSLLQTLDDADKPEVIEMLLKDKTEEKRTAGLDMIMELDRSSSPVFGKVAGLVSHISSPTDKEKILLEQINVTSESSTEDDLTSIFDPEADYEPVFDKAHTDECNALWNKVFPNKKLGKKLLSRKTKVDDLNILKALDELIEKNKDLEYESFGSMRLLGNGFMRLGITGSIPFADLWDAFYDEQINSREQILRLYFLPGMISSYFGSYTADIKGYTEFCNRYIELFLGPEYTNFNITKFEHFKLFPSIITYYFRKHDVSELLADISCALSYHIVNSDDPMIFRFSKTDIKSVRSYLTERESYERTPFFHPALAAFVSSMRKDKVSFPYKVALERKFEGDVFRYQRLDKNRLLLPSEYVSACAGDLISKDYMYKMLFEDVDHSLEYLSTVITSIRENGDSDRENSELIEGCYETMVSYCVRKELKRGDTPTEYSAALFHVKRIYGLDNLVGILKAFGKDTFNRSRYYYSRSNDSKKDILSHLLGVCVPDTRGGDTHTQAMKLKELIRGTSISDKRLIETALYAPEWLDIIGDYLGYDGFRSGCYYFMAHMNENFDDKRKAAIAKYSPISQEEFNNGAFDKLWFDEVYAALGSKKFEAIYDAAKYISDGAKHTRARKYADAATGKLDPKKTLEEIKAKRNKDLLMAYAIMKGTDKQIHERYCYIRQFIKESRQFGAQRRTSEKLAGETAIKNMATAQGYQDETRFILKMENAIASELAVFWNPQKIGEVEACLTVDSGKVDIKIVKGGKELKSVPAKLKKDEQIAELQEAKKTFTEQYRRTRIMLEEAMESKISFSPSEIEGMRNNPVLTNMVDSLVFECDGSFGLWKDLSCKKDSDVYVAHSYSMFKVGVWKDMQALIFDREIVQPFKQVFRELYVKTEEETNALHSMRYAGNQIQPQRTVGVLKNRRWVADVEEGLQKIYYKENIIATIFALADWFSPSDVEAPTLEYVAFIDRKTFKPMKIAEVPDIIFSEVMRDVDLAVSVAHVGGVDPEMSHSTVEMRRAIAEFSCKLFKLDNVSFTDSHALIKGTRAEYSVHLGSGVIHQRGGVMLNVLPVHSQKRGRIFLPFVDDDPKTAEVITKIVMFAEDKKIKDPYILEQLL